MIYSRRAQPRVNESHIHQVPKNNGLIFRMGEVSKLWRKTMVNMFFFVVLKSRSVFRSQKFQARVPERNSHVLKSSNCSVVFKML